MADTVIGVPDPSDASSAPGDNGSTSTTTGPADGKVPDGGTPGSNGPAADAGVASTTTVSISAEPPKQPRRLKPAETALVTVWLLALPGAMVIALSLWPLAEQVQLAAQKATAATTPTPEPPQLDLVIAHPRLTPGLSIIVIGISSGVLGSLVHTFTWLNQSSRGPSPTPRHKTHRPHDVVWFITAPLQGGLLALLVISAVSAGLLSTGQAQAATTVSLFTVVAIGGLTGLFSRRMTAKLAQLVNQVGPKNTTTTTISTAPGYTTTTTTTAPPHPGQDRDQTQTGVPPK